MDEQWVSACFHVTASRGVEERTWDSLSPSGMADTSTIVNYTCITPHISILLSSFFNTLSLFTQLQNKIATVPQAVEEMPYKQRGGGLFIDWRSGELAVTFFMT